MLYTVTVHKQDRRVKDGLRFKGKFDVEATSPGDAERQAQLIVWQGSYCKDYTGGYVYTVNETFVTRKNLLSGQEYQERFDTPHYCSPSSETYWSM